MEKRVYIRHIRSARIHGRPGTKLCARGLKVWARSHGFDIGDFIKNGVAVEDLARFTEDSSVAAVIAEAEKEWALQVV